ncbi:MAG: hypothetical protein IBX47_10080 [Desulfuromonadales bacterium]|nr:hypothetical protein [Desulfuromonadales bacterium]
MRRLFSRVILAGCFLLLAVASFAKPEPPGNLTKILGEVSEMEAKFERGDWADARETLEEIEAMYSGVYASYKQELPAELHKRFTSSTNALHQFLEAENAEKTENSFISMQVVLFELMGYFDYKVHPVIKTLKKYIGDEAQEALAKKDFANVQSELKEVVTFFSKNTSLFQQNGVSNADLQQFMSRLGAAIKQARSEDVPALKSSLDDLEQQIDAFHKAFTKI